MQDHLIDKDNLPNKIEPKNKKAFIDIANQKFDMLTALYPCGYLGKEHRLSWLCQCDCGNYVEVIGKNLRNGNTTSCGCYQKKRAVESNMDRGKPINPGDRFGRLTIIGFSHWEEESPGKRRAAYKCKCDCGNECTKLGVYLNFGDTRSCGCLNSLGEATIKFYLDENNISYEQQVTYNGCVSNKNNKLRFDFRINNFLIEYQGDVHYEENIRENGWNTKEYFEQLKDRDNRKKNFCKENNIKLYEITYKDDTIDKLIEILKKEGVIHE